MKTKAEQWLDQRPIFKSYNGKEDIALVDDDGNMYIQEERLTPMQALKLRDWLTDTFDTPNQINFEGVYETTHVVSDAKVTFLNIGPGFVGRTRDNQRAIYKYEKEGLHIWLVDGVIHHYDRITTYMNDDPNNPHDIVGPWEDNP